MHNQACSCFASTMSAYSFPVQHTVCIAGWCGNIVLFNGRDWMKRHKWYIKSFYFRDITLWSSSLVDHSTSAITALSSLLKKSFLWKRLTGVMPLFVRFCIKKLQRVRGSTCVPYFAWDLVGAGSSQCGAHAEKVPIFLHWIWKQWN